MEKIQSPEGEYRFMTESTVSETDFDKEFLYLYEICTISKQKVTIGKYLLEHPEVFSAYQNCVSIIVEALFHSAAVNICKITDERETVTAIKLANKCKRAFSQEINEEIKRLKPKKKDLDILTNRRDKNLAHSDIENLSGNISQAFPLPIEVLERVIDSTKELLEYLYFEKKSIRIRCFDKKVGKFVSQIDSTICRECEAIAKDRRIYKALADYVKKQNPLFLLELINGEENNGQTEDAHAE